MGRIAVAKPTRAAIGLLFLCVLGVVGCSSAPQSQSSSDSVRPSKVSLESFLLRLASLTTEEQATEYLEQVCGESFLAACEVLGRDVQGALARLAVMQGATTQSETQITALQTVEKPLFLLVWGASRRSPLTSTEVARIAVQGASVATQIVHYSIEGLAAGQTYRAQWVTKEGQLVDSRVFRTLNTQGRRVRVGVASCMDDSYEPLQARQWKSLLEEKPDALFFIGDNVYADRADGKDLGPANANQLWKRYFETRSRLAIFKSPTLVPIFAVWDDHDFGVNDGNQTFAYKDISREVFFAFFGNASFPGTLERGPGVSFRLDAFGQTFFFLDDRSFRSPPEKQSGKASTHFGRDIEAWVFSALDGRTPTWLISGDQFFGAYHPYESFEGNHPSSFRRFLERLKSSQSPVLFLSGDRHLTEIMRIEKTLLGYETFELTTSAIHAVTFPGAFQKAPNPRQIAGKDGEPNFFILDISTEGKWEVRARALGTDGRTLYRQTLYPADPSTRL